MKTLTVRSLLFITGLLAGVLTFWSLASSSKPLSPFSKPLEKITLSTSLDTKSALLYIAQDNGYFSQNSLKVTLKPFASGKIGCEQLEAGRVDIANFADFVLVSQVFDGVKSLRCIGAIAAADDHQLLYSKDRGILTFGDLRGRKIGAPRGTSAEFFLGRSLAFHDLAWKDIDYVNIKPTDMETALATGKVDAVMIWEQWAEKIKEAMDDQVGSWPGQSGQRYYWLLVTTDAFIKTRPAVLERVFKALGQAERFLKDHPQESVKIVSRRIGLKPAVVKAALTRSNCALSFDQSLLTVMEDEARWMIKNRMTEDNQVPNYLGYMKPETLAKVNPRVVTIIYPAEHK